MTTQSTPAPGLPELPKLPDLLNRALEAIVLLQTIRCHPRRHDMERSWLTDADRVIGYWEETRTAEAIRVHLSDLEAGRASRAQSEWQTPPASWRLLAKAAIELLCAIDAKHDTERPPTKYSVPYGAVNQLRSALGCAEDQPATFGETK
jgi:hypothetical protein